MILSLYTVSILTLDLHILSFNGFHLTWLIVHTTSLYLIIVLLLLLYTQGSVLGPIFFTMNIKPLSAIIDSHYIIHHSFADDLQLQMSAPHDKISELLHSMQLCISDVKLRQLQTWLNLMTTRQNSCLSPLKELSISITYILQWLLVNTDVPLKHCVKNFGFTLDCHFIMKECISTYVRTSYVKLCCLASICRFLPNTATATIVSTFVLSRVGHCKSLLFGCTHWPL